MNISLDELSTPEKFEDLVSEYFKELQKCAESSITQVNVKQSGVGTDGGRDILVEFSFFDKIIEYKRLWVVQCKFHNKNVSPNQINSVNIPTLIHSYGAVGYLLVCKKNPTSGITDLFERLNRECYHGYKYEIWTGSNVIQRVESMPQLHSTFFPNYYEYLESIRSKK